MRISAMTSMVVNIRLLLLSLEGAACRNEDFYVVRLPDDIGRLEDGGKVERRAATPFVRQGV